MRICSILINEYYLISFHPTTVRVHSLDLVNFVKKMEVLIIIFHFNYIELSVDHIIPSHYSLALTYAYQNCRSLIPNTTHYILLVDCGYTQLTVSLICYRNDGMEIIDSKTTTEVGGRILDSALINDCLNKIKKEINDLDGINQSKLFLKVKQAMIPVKHAVSLPGCDEVYI